MEDLHFQRRGAATAALPGRVAAGGRAKPAACYDDVFGGPPRAALAPAQPEDYREIFGAATTCSIPVLDLPPPPGDGYELRQCSALDYLDIFGGLGGGDFAASYQELFASQGSNEVGAPPLPSELGGAAPVTGARNSRGLKRMGSEEQEMPTSGVIMEGPSGDQVRCLSNGVAHHLNDDYTSNHVASWSSKNDSVHGTIHKNQVHAIPGFAFVVKSTEFDKPHTQVDVDIYFDAHCSKVISERQHLRKTMLSTTSCSDVKYSINDMKGDQRSTLLESSGSLSASACEENPSCSSKNQSTVPSSNGFSAQASNNQILHGNCMEKKTEGFGCNETVVTYMTTASSENDLKVKSTAVDFSANEGHVSHSSNGHSASAGIKSSPDHLTDAVSIDAVNTSTAEANHFTKSMSGSPPFTTSSRSSEDRMAEQKKSNSMYNLSKDATVNEGLHSFSSSTHSISSFDRSGPDGTFVRVSDINLRTQPSQGPPPARPPPARPSGRNLRRTWTEHPKHDMRTEVGYKSHSFKHAVRDGSPPLLDVEVDASSATAASLAAIKEAMELAQARLKSAKVSMERKKDNLQSRRKLGLNEDPRSINRYEDETVQQNQKIREELVIQLACEKTDDQTNVSTAEKVVTTFSPSLLTGDFKGKERDHGSAEESLQAMHWREPGLSNLSNKMEDKVGEWKVAGQFYEFIQSEKNLKKVPENSLKEENEKRSNARIGITGEEPIASELKTSGKLLAASKVMEWEGDRATNEKKTKDPQEAALESYMPGDCNLRQKETVNAHHQEKRLGEFQELQETEQETKWRTSKEAFICELSERNLRVNNDASKCKSVHGCQGHEKIQRSSGESSGSEETEKEIKVTEKYLRSQREEKDNLVWSKLSQLDDNKIEAKVTCVSHVSAKNIHLQTVGKNHECENLKMQTDGYDCFPEGQNIKAKEASLFFGRDKGWLSKAFEWAENEDEVEAPMEVHDWKNNDETFNVVQGTDGCSGEAKRLKEIQKFPIESEEFQLKVVEQQNTSCTAGIKDNFEDNVTVAQEYCKRKITENVKEVQVVDSNMGMKSAHDGCKAPQESSGNQVADWPVENGSQGHETVDVNGDKMKSEQTRYVEEKEEIRKLEEKERESVKFEEREKKRIELEEEKEGEKNLEVAKERERGKLKEEKERERKTEEEKVRERIRLEEERERERNKLEEEMERKKIEEERERNKLEEERERQKLEEKRERIRLEEERESERQKLEEERERIRLEEERERKRKKLEAERERQKLEQERERIRLEEERERERKKLEEERERQKLEEEREREKKLEEERERKKIEDDKREKKRLEEERERKKLEEVEERRKLEEEERETMRKKQEEEDRERCKLEEKERERRKQEEDRERRRLEEIERERRKLEEKVRERRRIEEEERERKLEEEKARERQKIEEDRLTEKRLDEEREKEWRKREEEKERERNRLEDEREREKEREKDRQAVERATREAHERAFAEARERAERAAVERITAEARQRAQAEARERAEKASVEALEKSLAEKASREARLRSERAAVERATAEARERAVEKAIAEKAAQDARERAEKLSTTTREGVKQNANVHASFTNEKFGGSEGESAIRCKARMERHQRTVERAAKALAEKNLRDIIAQREQAERNRLAETLAADVKRWSNGKEGNLRALLSTLQYILGPESGWQPIPLTDVVTAPAVKKAYRKATLCVHPDKLQQRGASIQQKYICEKVFDLLKEAWNKFNSEER